MINIDGQLTIKLMELILIFDNLVISHFQHRAPTSSRISIFPNLCPNKKYYRKSFRLAGIVIDYSKN